MNKLSTPQVFAAAIGGITLGLGASNLNFVWSFVCSLLAGTAFAACNALRAGRQSSFGERDAIRTLAIGLAIGIGVFLVIEIVQVMLSPMRLFVLLVAPVFAIMSKSVEMFVFAIGFISVVVFIAAVAISEAVNRR